MCEDSLIAGKSDAPIPIAARRFKLGNHPRAVSATDCRRTARGELDGYCAGEPWAAQAEVLGAGRRVIRSGQLWPGHPEKVLACRREFAALQPETAAALTATLLEACRWLDVSANRQQAVDWLPDPEVIGLPAERIAACLLPSDRDDPAQSLRFHADGEVNFPWRSDGRWFLHQFRRWGWLPAASHERTLSRWRCSVVSACSHSRANSSSPWRAAP